MGVGKRTVDEYLEALASPSPTPGGGSVAALCGALSAALSRMVSGLAVGKEGYESVQADLSDLQGRAKALQDRLLRLADEDAAAYDSVIAAMRLPKKTDAERAVRVEAMQGAYRHATEVPLETMAACAEALGFALMAAQKGNRNAITDAGVAALTAEAGIRAASLNVRINLTALRDNELRSRIEDRLAAILRDADRVGHETMALVEGRL
ncbi:MAG TPA: cyclodeaminase/cyclohydrolase family protein [Thermoplasmata archaeon]|nr:cyclodeaminase/cyclohydrolase family protein [Thermoplasmata archaeon]